MNRYNRKKKLASFLKEAGNPLPIPNSLVTKTASEFVRHLTSALYLNRLPPSVLISSYNHFSKEEFLKTFSYSALLSGVDVVFQDTVCFVTCMLNPFENSSFYSMEAVPGRFDNLRERLNVSASQRLNVVNISFGREFFEALKNTFVEMGINNEDPEMQIYLFSKIMTKETKAKLAHEFTHVMEFKQPSERSEKYIKHYNAPNQIEPLTSGFTDEEFEEYSKKFTDASGFYYTARNEVKAFANEIIEELKHSIEVFGPEIILNHGFEELLVKYSSTYMDVMDMLKVRPGDEERKEIGSVKKRKERAKRALITSIYSWWADVYNILKDKSENTL